MKKQTLTKKQSLTTNIETDMKKQKMPNIKIPKQQMKKQKNKKVRILYLSLVKQRTKEF